MPPGNGRDVAPEREARVREAQQTTATASPKNSAVMGSPPHQSFNQNSHHMEEGAPSPTLCPQPGACDHPDIRPTQAGVSPLLGAPGPQIHRVAGITWGP